MNIESGKPQLKDVKYMQKFNIKRVHASIPEELYNRMYASGIFRDMDSIIADLIEEYLEKMGY